MFRLVVVMSAIAFAVASTEADAQTRGRHSYHQQYRHGSWAGRPYAQPGFGLSIGVGTYPFGYFDAYRFDGFGHDPYRSGRFKVPDLLDDPYFQARQRYLDHQRASQSRNRRHWWKP